MDEGIDGNELVQRPCLRHQLCYRGIVPRDTRREVGKFHIGPLQHLFRVESVAHGRHVAGDGAVAEGHHKPGVAADEMSEFFMLDVGDCAFDEGDIHIAREVLDVCNGEYTRVILSARSMRRSSRSRSDIWQPEQPPSHTVATLSFMRWSGDVILRQYQH